LLKIIKKSFLCAKISILEGFLRNHVTLKTAENSALPSQE